MFWIHGVCLVIIITAHWHSPSVCNPLVIVSRAVRTFEALEPLGERRTLS